MKKVFTQKTNTPNKSWLSDPTSFDFGIEYDGVKIKNKINYSGGCYYTILDIQPLLDTNKTIDDIIYKICDAVEHIGISKFTVNVINKETILGIVYTPKSKGYAMDVIKCFCGVKI